MPGSLFYAALLSDNPTLSFTVAFNVNSTIRNLFSKLQKRRAGEDPYSTYPGT